MDLGFKTIKELLSLIEKNVISEAEILEATLKRINTHNKKINAIIEEPKNLESSKTNGKLHSIPGLLKDNILIKDKIASAGSKILKNYKAVYDSTASTRLKNEGAVLIGRGNCDEFAMGSSNEYSAYGPVKNPWNLECVAGGSSGGPAAAVAAGLVPWSLGSETGGSVRLPAAFCGIVGSKPTYGLVSRFGLIAYASSLDQIGVFSRTVYDNALILSIIAGKDDNDGTTLDVKNLDFTSGLNGKIKPGMKIGIIENAMNTEGISQEVRIALENAIKQFEKLGAQIVKVKLPTMDHSAAVYFMLSRAEAASNLSRFDGVRYGHRAKDAKTLSELYDKSRSEGFGKIVKLRILLGNYVLSVGHSEEYYHSAKIVQYMMKQEIKDLFKNVDLLFAPVHPKPAFKLGQLVNDVLAMDLMDYFTCFANLTGVPALAFPCGFTKDNMPIGCQLIGPHLGEKLIFETAHAYEQSTDWHKMHPKDFA